MPTSRRSRRARSPIQLSSPSHRLTLHRNRLVLTPSAGGDPDAWVEAEFEGAGDLVADLEGGSLATQLRDHVVVPRQTVRLRGKVRVTRDAESYRLRVLEAPPSVPVRIRSGLVDRCVAVCRGLGLLAVVDCGRLERALSTVQVPIRSDQAALRLPHARLSEPIAPTSIASCVPELRARPLPRCPRSCPERPARGRDRRGTSRQARQAGGIEDRRLTDRWSPLRPA